MGLNDSQIIEMDEIDPRFTKPRIESPCVHASSYHNILILGLEVYFCCNFFAASSSVSH